MEEGEEEQCDSDTEMLVDDASDASGSLAGSRHAGED